MRIINGMESSMMAMNMDMNTMSMQMQVQMQMHMIIMMQMQMQMQMQMTSMKMMDKMDNMKLDNKDMKMGYAHSCSDEVPKGLKEAKNSTFKVGSQAVVKAHHREGMYGAKATIVGAYYTTAYAVTYTPTTGGAKVKNHKWVIQEEIKNAGTEILKPGMKVTLEAKDRKSVV